MKQKTNSRRQFIQKVSSAGLGLAALSLSAQTASANTTRPGKGTYMGGFIAPKLDTVKIAIIGCGARGGTHYNHTSAFEGTEIVGICDLYEGLCEKAKKKVLSNGKGTRHQNVKLYHGDKTSRTSPVANGNTQLHSLSFPNNGARSVSIRPDSASRKTGTTHFAGSHPDSLRS